MESKRHEVLYISKRDTTLWMLVILAISMFVLTCWLVSMLTDEQLLTDFDSLVSGRIFQLSLITIGTLFIWPMVWLSNKYVVEITKGESVFIKTWSLAGTRIHRLENDGVNPALSYHDGRPDFAMTNAPYLSFKKNGKKFIVDMQGSFPKGEDALTHVLTF